MKQSWFNVVVGCAAWLCNVADAVEVKNCTYFYLPETYNFKQAPCKDTPVNVTVEVEVWSILEVSAQNMDMHVDLYVTLRWIDQLLLPIEKKDQNESWVTLEPEEAALLWRPTVIFRNCKGCKPINLDPTINDFLWHTKEHMLKTTIRDMKRFSCSIDLTAYPLDYQVCKIQIENYIEESYEVVLKPYFHKQHQVALSNMTLGEFSLDPFRPSDCTIPLYGLLPSCTEVLVGMRRNLGYHIMTIYSPTILIVLLSWVSFWLPLDALPGRVTLGVTSLLTLATRLDQSQKNLPPVSYAKAVDVWMFTCLFLVFASLVEFAFGYYIWHRKSHKKAEDTTEKKMFSKSASTTTKAFLVKVRPADVSAPTLAKTKSEIIGPLTDRISRIVFPVTFAVFNIAYWPLYRSYSDRARIPMISN